MSHSYPNKPYITTRASKSAALTHDEMDFNLASLVHKVTTSFDGSQITFSYAPIKEGGTTIKQNDDVVVDVLPSAEYITKKLKYENLELGDVQADTVIAGTVKAGNLSVDENIVATGSVTASGFYTEGKIFAYNRIDTDGDLVVGNDLRVDGVISASLIADPNDNFVINSDGVEADHFYAYSDIYAEGNIHAEGNLTADEDLTVLGSASVAGELRVTGSTHIRGHLYAEDNVEVFGTLKASPDGEGRSSWSIYDGGSAVFKELHATGSLLARNDGVYIKGIGNYTGGSLPDYSSVDLATVFKNNIIQKVSSSLGEDGTVCVELNDIRNLFVAVYDGGSYSQLYLVDEQDDYTNTRVYALSPATFNGDREEVCEFTVYHNSSDAAWLKIKPAVSNPSTRIWAWSPESNNIQLFHGANTGSLVETLEVFDYSTPNIAPGTGEGSVVQRIQSPYVPKPTAFGVNSTAFGTSTTDATARGITIDSSADEILNEWVNSHPEDEKFALTLGTGSHAEGNDCLALGNNSHAEGNGNVSSNDSSHAEGTGTYAMGKYSHAEGYLTKAEGLASHAEGATYNNIDTAARADAAHAEGAGVVVKGQAAHGEGVLNVAGRTQEEAVAALADFPNLGGTTEQKVAKLIGFGSHVEGTTAQALGASSHAEGNSTQALVNATHAEGDSTTASGEAAHSEGYKTTASGNQAHAEGYKTTASGNQSHAEGESTTASGINSHAEGYRTYAYGATSHTEGYYTVADNNVEHAEGQYNKSNTGNTAAEKTIHSVGIGTSKNARKNAFEIMQNGDAYLKGVGGYDGTNATSSASLTLQELITPLIVSASYDSKDSEFTVSDSAFNLILTTYPTGKRIIVGDSDAGMYADIIAVDSTNATIETHLGPVIC